MIRRPDACATNAMTAGRARFRIATQWFSRSGSAPRNGIAWKSRWKLRGGSPQRGLADHGGDPPLGHGTPGLGGVVGREGGLGQDVEAGEHPGAFVTTQITDMTDASLPQEFGGQEREQCLQRRDLLRAGPSRGGDGPGQVEVQEHGKEQEEAGDLGRESSAVLQRQRADVGDVGHDGAVAGELARLRRRASIPGLGQARAAEDAEEIRLADVKALGLERGADVGQGAALTAEGTGTFLDCLAFRGGLATERLGGKEGVEVGVAREVVDDGSDGADMELEPLGELVGGGPLEEVGAAEFVAALGRGVGLLKEAREILGSGHRELSPE